MIHDVGAFCTRDKGTGIYGMCTAGRKIIGAISRAPADEKEYKKTIEVRVEAYMPRVRVTRRELESGKGYELRLRVERFQIFYEIKSARSAP